MSYHLDVSTIVSPNVENDGAIVIDGFENGIADSAYLGIADIRNANINSTPKQASVMFGTSAVTLPPSGFSGTAFSATATTDIITTASTTGFYIGMAVTINTVSGAGGLTAGLTYYVNNITPTTFKLYSNIGSSLLIDITIDITGTFTVKTFGTPVDSVSSLSGFYSSIGTQYKHSFVMCFDGSIWYLSPIKMSTVSPPINTLQYLGNEGHSSTGTNNIINGIEVFNGYLFVFMDTKIDYLPTSTINIGSSLNPANNWSYAWQTITTSNTGHRALSATDDVLYFCNGTNVGSVIHTSGTTFDPTSTLTYKYTQTALFIPNDTTTCLSQLGSNLLVGGVKNFIYPWDRVSTGFSYPLIIGESFIKCIVSTNTNSFIFAGQRGRIYITNGTNVEEWIKLPDSLSGTVEPYYNWGWGVYRKNQLYFTVSATDNAGTTINNFAGIWAIDLKTNALRMSNSLSYGTYSGSVPTILPMGNVAPTGDGIYAFWDNSGGGIDYTSNTPYSNYETTIDTDIIPVGTYLAKRNFTSIEFKLAKRLISGEKIKISWREDLTSAFTQIGETTTAGVISDVYTPNFSNLQWIQFRINISSTASSPSYVPLREIRIR